MLHLGSITRKKVSDFAPPAPVPFTESFYFSHAANLSHSLSQNYTPPVTPHKYIIVSFFANFINWKETTSAFQDFMWIPFTATDAACFGIGNMYRSNTSSIARSGQYVGPGVVKSGTLYGVTSASWIAGPATAYHGCIPQDRWVHMYGVMENTADGAKQRMWMNGIEYKVNPAGSTASAVVQREFTKIYLSYSTGASGYANTFIKMSSICIHGCDDLNMPFDIFNPDEFMPQFVMDDGRPRKVAFSPNIFLNQKPGEPLINQVNNIPLTATNCNYSTIPEAANIKYEGSYFTKQSIIYVESINSKIASPDTVDHPYYIFYFGAGNSWSITNSDKNAIWVTPPTAYYFESTTTDNLALRRTYPEISTLSSHSMYITPASCALSINEILQTVTTSGPYSFGAGITGNAYLSTGFNSGTRIVLMAIYDARDTGLIDWTDVVTMERRFMNADGTLKDGGRRGLLYLQDTLGNPIEPALMLDARYGYAQCSVSGSWLLTSPSYLYATNPSTLVHASKGSPIVRGDVLP
jgi:hypothetical protein